MTNHARDNAQAWMEDISAMMARFDTASDDQDEIIDEIYSSALSAEVSSGWVPHGKDLLPSKYRVVLTFGGPSLSICGDLNDYGEVISAELVYADQSTDPTPLLLSEEEEEDLLRFASMFFPC